MDDFFAENLRVLQQVSPHLAERLCWAVESDHIVRFPDGSIRYRQHLDYLPFEVSSEQIDALLPHERTGALFVFGAGFGEIVSRWFETGGESAAVWERDPFIVRLMMAARDWREVLLSGRLTISLGVDLVSSSPRSSMPVAYHPLLRDIYRNELFLLHQGCAGPLVFVVHGGLFVDDISDALRDEGYSVYTLDMARLSMNELDEAVQRTHPCLIVRVNHIEGLAEFAERHALPVIEWEVDPALTAVLRAPSTNRFTHIFTWRKRHVESFHEAGFANVHYLPLATNPVRRRRLELAPEEQAAYLVPLSFVGASMADRTASLRRDFRSAWTAAFPDRAAVGDTVLENILREQRSDYSSYLVPEIFKHYAPDFVVPRGELEPERIVGELVAAERRLSVVQALVPFGVHVWGDEAWQRVAGLQWHGLAPHGDVLNKIYSHSQINIDIGRFYQLDIVTMRVFDIVACGGFVLAEHSEDLEELFAVGEEVESWRTVEELLDKVRYYLNHPEARHRIAQQGNRAVCERHTIRQRLQVMLRVSGVKNVSSTV